VSRRTLIIAEAGVNHDGDLEKALALVQIAVSARADVVKFQTFSADRLITKTAPKAAYQVLTTGDHESQWAMLKRLEISADDHRVLMAECDRLGIEFLSTPFDEESADMLAEMGVRRFKIASGEATNLPFLRHLASYGKPLILSTGMCDLSEVRAAVDAIRESGDPPLMILHCVSVYPAAPEDCNLRAMATMADAFNVPVGFSDHTLGLEVSFAAVALGAAAIEKHFTMNRADPGPDHRASLTSEELHGLVSGIRAIEASLGDGKKRRMLAEDANSAAMRKSIVTTRAIRAGDILTREDLAVRRPGTGLAPSEFNLVLGRRSSRDLAAGDPVTADALCEDR
jgi:N,N'-diacetyllegionaminate synthase